MAPGKIDVRNRLLAALSDADFETLAPHLEHLTLPRLFQLSEPNQVPDYCYFLEAGIGSIVATSTAGQRAEIGLFGRDGMSPTSLVLNAGSSPYSIFMQVAGHGYRLQSALLAHAIAESSTLRNLLSRYAQAMSVQTAFTALTNASHHIEERLARWILMCHDRVDTETINLTHDFLSIMLSIRRQSVTTALHVLEGKHLVSNGRGHITVRDRKGLEEFAGDAYGQPEEEYTRLIGTI